MTGLQVRSIVDKLSQNIVVGVGTIICKKVSNCLIQSISAVVEAIALYTASVEDQEAVFCFLEDQYIGFEPKNTKPVIDLLSLGSPA